MLNDCTALQQPQALQTWRGAVYSLELLLPALKLPIPGAYRRIEEILVGAKMERRLRHQLRVDGETRRRLEPLLIEAFVARLGQKSSSRKMC